MKRVRPQADPVSNQEKEGRSSEKEATTAAPSPKRSRAAAHPTPAQEEEATSNQTTALGLEAVGDDVLLLIMDLCGPTDSLRAFLLANRRLNALLRSHRALWSRAYTRLFASPPRNKNEKPTTDQAPLQHHLAGVEDYFEAYAGAMRKWTGAFRFDQGDVPLGESDGELTVKVAADGRATWEGHGVGCGRAGEYTSLNCLKGEGALVLRFNKKGEIQAFAEGHEKSLEDRCERRRGSDDEDEDEDEDDDDDDDDEDDEELDEKARKERQKKREEKQKEKEEREKEKEKEKERAKEKERRERKKRKKAEETKSESEESDSEESESEEEDDDRMPREISLQSRRTGRRRPGAVKAATDRKAPQSRRATTRSTKAKSDSEEDSSSSSSEEEEEEEDDDDADHDAEAEEDEDAEEEYMAEDEDETED